MGYVASSPVKGSEDEINPLVAGDPAHKADKQGVGIQAEFPGQAFPGLIFFNQAFWRDDPGGNGLNPVPWDAKGLDQMAGGIIGRGKT